MVKKIDFSLSIVALYVKAFRTTVDSLYLDYSLSRTSLYFEQTARSLGHLLTL